MTPAQTGGAEYRARILRAERLSAQHEFARGTACLQRTRDVKKAALVTVDSMRQATLQHLARVIEPLLYVADSA